jgi:hypothetical protein
MILKATNIEFANRASEADRVLRFPATSDIEEASAR